MSAFTDISVATSPHTRVIEHLRQIVVTALQGNQVSIQLLRDIVDLMRKNEISFPHYRNYNTYKLFEPPVFENKKVNHGYWFRNKVNEQLFCVNWPYIASNVNNC